MEQMTRRIILAAVLGALIGAAVGYSPWIQPTNPPRALLFQQAAQPNAAFSTVHPFAVPIQLLMALVAGLLVATPVFLISKRRNQN
jgi:hypothetical protein